MKNSLLTSIKSVVPDFELVQDRANYHEEVINNIFEAIKNSDLQYKDEILNGLKLQNSLSKCVDFNNVPDSIIKKENHFFVELDIDFLIELIITPNTELLQFFLCMYKNKYYITFRVSSEYKREALFEYAKENGFYNKLMYVSKEGEMLCLNM
jgi:hypothetical protein